MKNPLNLTIVTLPGSMPNDAIICAADLANRHVIAQELESLLANAHQERETLIRQAQVELEQARQDADALRQAAQQDAVAISRQACDAAVKDAVEWLCCERDLERIIAQDLTQRWRTLTARVLEEILGANDQNELVLRRVERKVVELLPHGSIKLRVSPAALAAANRLWEGNPEIRVIADPTLNHGQARLETDLVRIHFDTPAQQASLLAQFEDNSPKALRA